MKSERQAIQGIDPILMLTSIRIAAVLAMIGIIAWERHHSASIFFGIINSQDWPRIIFAGTFVILSLLLADRLIWRIIIRITHRSFISESDFTGVSPNVIEATTTRPDKVRRHN